MPNFQRRQTLVPNQIANKPKPTVPVAFQFRSALRATKKLTGDHDQVEKDQLKKVCLCYFLDLISHLSQQVRLYRVILKVCTKLQEVLK